MTPPPLISVLLAVHNGEKYLREAVESILRQTCSDFEFIAIDDGSKDGTLGILRHYAIQHPNLKIVTRPNKGLTVTLNEGLAMARGEFLARMDADDISMPTRFAQQVEFLRENPDTVLLGTRVLLVDPDGLPIRQACTEVTHEQIDHAHLNRGWPVVHPSVMMRTAAVRQVGGYRDEYNALEDLDLFLRLAEVGRLANLPDVLLHYRQHFASVSHEKVEKQAKLRDVIYKETCERRGLPPPVPNPLDRTTPRKRFEQHSAWAWAALKAGNVPTARKHAFATVRHKPLSLDSWRLWACAQRGR
jgi:glycosyltransferase involved in cell wall biosynthesis